MTTKIYKKSSSYKPSNKYNYYENKYILMRIVRMKIIYMKVLMYIIKT